MKKSILVADDDRLLVKALKKSLSELGYDIHTATNGSEAIDVITDHKIDLVICDIMMPQISGIPFVVAIKNSYRSNTPVIVISSLPTGKQITESLGDDRIVFLNKPFSFDTLTDLTKKFLHTTL
ncbi:MAG: response regulator [Bacteroidetes bacterium]|jgi:CheY-like chemotaxis protein|nr:response regulator [Bacteroidota bacterium]